jgi:hypothetical protein
MKCEKSWKRDVATRRGLKMLAEGKTMAEAQSEKARTMKLTREAIKRELEDQNEGRKRWRSAGRR